MITQLQRGQELTGVGGNGGTGAEVHGRDNTAQTGGQHRSDQASHTQQVPSMSPHCFTESLLLEQLLVALILINPILQASKLRPLPKPHCYKKRYHEASILPGPCPTHDREQNGSRVRTPNILFLLPLTSLSLLAGHPSPASLHTPSQAPLDLATPSILQSHPSPQAQTSPALPSAQPPSHHPLPPTSRPSLISPPGLSLPPLQPQGLRLHPPVPSEHLSQKRNPICVKGLG